MNFIAATQTFRAHTPASLIAICLLFILAGCGNPSQQDNEEMSNIHYQQALSHFSNGRYRTASIETKNALQKNPKNIDAVVLTAKILNAVGQYQQAIEFLTQATPIPEHVGFKQQLATAYIGRKKYYSALKALGSAETINTSLPVELQLLVAKSYQGQGNVDTAKSLYQEIIATDPSQALAYAGLTEIYLREENTELALNTLQTGREKESNNFELKVIDAQIKMEERNFEAAEELLTDALLQLKDADTMTPRKANTLTLLAESLVKQGRSAEALIYTRLLADAFPGYEIANSTYEEAETLAKAGKANEAIELLNQLLEDNPNFERASTLLAVLKYTQGDFDTASNYFNKTVDAEVAHPELTRIAALANLQTKNPQAVIELLQGYPQLNNDSKLLGLLGNALLSTKQYQQAKTALDQSLAIDGSNIQSHITMAAYYNELNEAEKALKHLETAYTASSDNRLLPAALARQYVGLKQIDKAEKLIKDQINRFNGDSLSHELAGDFYQYRNDAQRAISHYQQSISKNSSNDRAALKVANLLINRGANSNEVYAAFAQAIKANPQNAGVFQRLLDYGKQSNTIDQAEKTLSNATTGIDATVANAITAIYFARNQELSKAEAYRNRLNTTDTATEITNKVEETLSFAKAVKAFNDGDIPVAREQAYAGLKVAPKSIGLMKLIADIEVSQSNFSEAEKLVNQITNVDARLGMQLHGDLNAQLGDAEKAAKFYQSLWDEYPSDIVAGKLYLQLAKIDLDARNRFFKQWKTAFPKSLGVLEVESQTLLANNRYQDAIPLMEQLMRATPNNVTNLNNLAWSYLQVGDERALAIAEQAYSLASGNASVADTYGWILFKSGNRDKAIEVLQNALDAEPNNADIQAHLNEATNG